MPEMHYIGEVWIVVFTFLCAFAPGPMMIGPRREPCREVSGWRALVIRSAMFVVGATVIADLVVQLSGGTPFLR